MEAISYFSREQQPFAKVSMLRLFPARRCLYQSLHHTFARARTSTFPTLATSLSRYIIDSSEPHLHSQAWLLRPNPAQGLSTLSEVQSGTPQASEEELEHGDPDWQDTASSSDLHLLQHQEAEQSGGWYSQVGSPATEELASTGSSQYSAGPQQAKFSDTYEEGQRYSSINELGYLEDSEDSSSVPCSGSDTLLPKEIDVNYRQAYTLPELCLPFYFIPSYLFIDLYYIQSILSFFLSPLLPLIVLARW